MQEQQPQQEYGAFKIAAGNALRDSRSLLLEWLGDVPSGGFWHPAGFAIWNVSRVTDLGFIRLHIWPDSGRVSRPWGPRIHRHAWHLASMVLTGTYRDTLYEDSEAQQDPPLWQAMVSYQIDVLPSGGRSLIALRAPVYVRVFEPRDVAAPEFHHIPAGVFHETVIPDTDFVATLVLLGEQKGPVTLALEEERFPPRSHDREPVDTRAAEDWFLRLRDCL